MKGNLIAERIIELQKILVLIVHSFPYGGTQHCQPISSMAYHRWEQTIDGKLEATALLQGHRFPGKEGNVCECSVPLPPDSIALAQLAEKASQCDEPESLTIPAVLLGTYF